MTLFLDVQAVRIQQYLGRMPTLRGLRAASALIVDATSTAATTSYLADSPIPAHINSDIGDIDGKLSVVADDANDAQAQALAEHLMDHLRRRLPAIQLEALWGRGADYVIARALAIEPMRAGGRQLVSLPAASEWPLARPCDRCSASAASGYARDHDDDSVRVCADCAARLGSRESRNAEHALAEALGQQLVRDFAALVALSTDRKANHLATFYADGNSMADFFTTVVNRQVVDKTGLSKALADVTRDALADAVRAVSIGPELAVVPHVVGGDDLLVSMPASHAWRFALHYLAGYQRRAVAAVAAVAPQMADLAPTASAGLVFAHYKHPFLTNAALAGRLLRRAKSGGGAPRSALAWSDVTRHGDSVVDHLPVLTLDEFELLEPARLAIAALDRSRQARLGEVCDLDDPVALRSECRRLGIAHDLRVLVGPPMAPIATWRALLDMARWWPNP